MHLLLCTLWLQSAPAAAKDVYIDGTDPEAVRYSPGFIAATSPYAQGGRYLSAPSQGPGARPGSVRVAAPPGEFYVYLTWVRDPRGARDVRVRIADLDVTVDQSLLANGRSPDDFERDDMPSYDGRCSSGLFRLTDRPLRLRQGDAVEITRSDTEIGRVTTLDGVLFSPHLYLDDMGNDARLTGRPVLNIKDYGHALSGEAGLGIAFVKPQDASSAVELTVPADGAFLLAADPNRGPSRAGTMHLTVALPDGGAATLAVAGRSASFGRGEWQTLGALTHARGARIRLNSAPDGFACLDLLRLTPVAESDLGRTAAERCHEFVLQWHAASPRRPWLRDVRAVSAGDGAVQVLPVTPAAGFAHAALVRVPWRRLPVIGATDGRGLPTPSGGSFRVELADDYGFTVTADLMQRARSMWLPDVGMLVNVGAQPLAEAEVAGGLRTEVERGAREPFRSPSERYFALTGYDETRPSQDDRAFEFAYDPSRPLLPRVHDAIASMPEADYAYFASRVPDPRHRRMFLGWPDVAQEFYVLSNGALGVSSNAGAGTGHPPAQHFTVEIGVGEPPAFREQADRTVTQCLEDGYQLAVHTRWNAGDAQVRTTAFAYPLAGEEVRTGNEPLGAFVRLRRRSPSSAPLWLRVRPEQWNGPANPLTGLSGARVDGGRLVAGSRTVLAADSAGMEVVSATDAEVLVRLAPESEHADLVIPYVAVARSAVDDARALGFDAALARMKRYWNARLAQGATIQVPDPVVCLQYNTLYPRTLMCGDLDVEGDHALKTSPIVYDAVWLHATAYGIEGLARRGHFAEARQYLEAAFHWQGSQPSETGTFTTWKGFFTAPPRYTAALWLNFHGWMQWAAARYSLFSDDRAWLEDKLPALIDSLEWTASQRKLTMHESPDGSRPPSWGWLPPGRVTDASAGTSTFTDCINWMGFDELTRVLERVGHPRTAEFRAVADDYRRCILRGLRLATRGREPVRRNDGTYVPYVPGYLESHGHEETMWYAGVVDGALEGILDSGIVPPGDPLEDWVLGNLEDNLFVIAPNLADEAYFLGHGCAYVRRDEARQAIYTFYSVLASHMARETLTTFEHRSWGAGRVYELSPWPMGYYTRMLSGMLCDDRGEGLIYGKATPEAWLAPGKEIRVDGLQTRFGPTSFHLCARSGGLSGTIDLPTRYPAPVARLRLRTAGIITAVTLNGQPAPLDPATGTVDLPPGAARVVVEATVAARPSRP